MQNTLLNVQTQWVYVFKSMFENGDVAKMGGGTFIVYTALKCFSEIATGENAPTVASVANYSGLSERMVQNHLKTLEKMGYLRIIREDGKPNKYVPIDKFDYYNPENGNLEARAHADYLPAIMREVVQELKNFSVTANAEGAKTINIETINLTVNVQHNARDGYQTTNYRDIPLNDPKLKAIAQRIQAKSGGKD